MKLTSKKLKQLIREELEKVIKEADYLEDPADPRSWGQAADSPKRPEWENDPADPRSWGGKVDANLECWALQYILDKQDDDAEKADLAMKEKGCIGDKEPPQDPWLSPEEEISDPSEPWY